MTPLMQLIPSLDQTQKIQLISALSDRMLYPQANRGFRYYELDGILEAEPDFESLTIDDAKGLIRAIANHI